MLVTETLNLIWVSPVLGRAHSSWVMGSDLALKDCKINTCTSFQPSHCTTSSIPTSEHQDTALEDPCAADTCNPKQNQHENPSINQPHSISCQHLFSSLLLRREFITPIASNLPNSSPRFVHSHSCPFVLVPTLSLG